MAAGAIRSCFMMTEPAPGAGADPSMLLTAARRDGDEFVIDGRKWLITGAVGASLAIVMARNDSDVGGPAGSTMFLTPMNVPGIHIERVLDTLDQYMTGGHAVVRLDGLRVHQSQVLGRVGEGFRYAQVRLAPARLTHCMRWLGAARRAHDIATDYARRRSRFTTPATAASAAAARPGPGTRRPRSAAGGDTGPAAGEGDQAVGPKYRTENTITRRSSSLTM